MRTSVIIPVQDRPDLIRRAISSIQAQTIPVGEVIMCASDDASARSAEVMGCRIVSVPRDGGPAAARNEGMGHAVGELMLFIDSDDLWLEGYVEAVLSAIGNAPGTLAGVRYRRSPITRPPSLLHVVTSAFTVRRSMAEEHGGFDEVLPCWQECRKLGCYLEYVTGREFALVPEVLVEYHPQRDSLTRRERPVKML